MADEIPKLDLKSKNITEEQKNRLKQLFPEVFTEGRIDFDKLKQTLGEDVESDKERYELVWAGKSDCIRVAQEQTTATLKPSRDESVDFDTTKNLFIEGDNLEVLKLLQKSYSGMIKMIYIDPPYNTGNDFVYNDKFGEELQNYLKQTGQTDEQGRRFSTNTETGGRYHSSWLSMIYPRIYLARNLLTEDGLIVISIGEEEVDNLKKICDEIFGGENFINKFIVKRRIKSLNSQFEKVHTLNQAFEYLVVYSKSEYFSYAKPLKESQEQRKEGYWNSFWNTADRPTMRYQIAGVKISKGQWKWSPERGLRAYNNYQKFIALSGDETKLKEYWLENHEEYLKKTGFELEFIKPTENSAKYWVSPSEETIMDTNMMDYYVNDDAGRRNYCFDTTKSIELIKKIIDMCTEKDSVILDFFAGSGTTAHAVLDLNMEAGTKRHFILVQLPESTRTQNEDGTWEETEAWKAGYKTIADISKARIRRVIKENKEELKQVKLEEKQVDLGFKVFKLAKSNFKVWDVSPQESIQSKLLEHVETVEKNCSTEDLLYELIFKDGLELTEKIDVKTLAGKKIYSIMDTMLVCLEKDITLELVKEISKLKPSRVICLDEGFRGNDQLKTNAVQIFKKANEGVIFKTV